MEKKHQFIQLNMSVLDLGKGIFAGAFCAGFISMFGLESVAVVAFCYAAFLALICEIIRKPFGYVLPIFATAAIAISEKEALVKGIKAFANEISDAYGIAYGKIVPRFEGVETDKKEQLIFALALFGIAVVIFGLLMDVAGRATALIALLTMILIICTSGTQLNPWIILMLADAAILAGKKTSALRTLVAVALTVIIAFGVVSLIGDVNLERESGSLEFTKSDEIALTVTMEKPQSMYLRGESYDLYDKGQWEDFSGQKKYEDRELFYWLHQADFYGQSQLATVAMTFDKSLEKEKNSVHVDIQKADKSTLYVPYEVLNGNIMDESQIGDGEIRNAKFGEKSYDFETLPNQVKSYARILSDIVVENAKVADGKEMSKSAKEYLDIEKYYNGYIYDNYLQLDENEKALLTSMLGKYKLKDKSHYDYLKAKEKILECLADNITYDEEATYSGDFIDQFLTVTCNGYSLHYASAGVLMMRYYGIPARLASGYLITPKDVKLMEANAPFNVTENSRHYWVEYYQDGIGWIPFEVTPPYIGIMESENHLAAVNQKPKTEEEEKHKIKKDNYKKPQKQKEPERDNWLTAHKLVIILSLIALLIICALAALYFMRKKGMYQQRFESGMNSENLSKRAVFEFMLLNEIGKRYESISKDIELYDESNYGIYQKARYSEKGIAELEYEQFDAKTTATKAEILEKCNGLQKLAWKYWWFY